MKRDAQVKIIKRHLLKGYSISTMEAISRYSITRLSEHIFRLIKAGFKVDSEWLGKGQEKYKTYFIKEENL